MKRIETVFISVGFSILVTLSILLVLGNKISNTLFPSAQPVPYGLRADGDPVPPFPLKPASANLADTVVVIADGDPVPPFPHPPLGSNLRVGELRHHAAGEGQLSSV